MELKYLGTAAAEGWPALFCECPSCQKARKLGGKNIRTRSQALIDGRILVDFCPDTYAHVLHQGLPLWEIQHCIVTHGHTDHFYATDLMMKARPYAQAGKDKVLHLYGTERISELFDRMRRLEDDSENLKECIKLHAVRPFEPFLIMEYRITPMLAKHDPAECCLIYLIENSAGKILLYGNDTSYFPEETWEFLKGKKLDGVSLDCTMGVLENGPTHLSYQGDVETKKRLTDMGCIGADTVCILTHFSHNCGSGISHEEMEEKARKDGFLTAYDGFAVQI